MTMPKPRPRILQSLAVCVSDGASSSQYENTFPCIQALEAVDGESRRAWRVN
jgi:hypothetical protein